jgi:colicin import membrane protein
MTTKASSSWLRRKALEGLTELPSNAAWLLGKAFPDPDQPPERNRRSDNSTIGAGVRRVRRAVTESMPLAPDTVEGRIKSAQEAVDATRRAEQDAVEAAEQAMAAAAAADDVAEAGKQRMKEAQQARDDEVAERVAQAQARADELVAEERAVAEEDADRGLDDVRREVDAENERAQQVAEQARAHAVAQVENAASQMVEARRLSDEAARAAQEAADRAHQEAEGLARRADHLADEAEDQLKTTSAISSDIRQTAAETVRAVRDRDELPELDEQTCAELQELAAGLGVEHRSHMRKAELVDAIKKSTASTRR